MPRRSQKRQKRSRADIDRLTREFRELERAFADLLVEHLKLEERPVNPVEHAAHREKLREHIAAVREYIARLRASRE